jgi:ribulose-5-phosphate 4-epimerase/fuculose-1-phosphate aldolase
MLLDFVRYHDYEGIADNLDERERIVRDLGEDGRIIVLRNHGALTVGRTIAEAFVWMYRFEMACQYQVAGLSGVRPLHTLSDDGIAHVRAQGRRLLSTGGKAECGRIEWPALIRKLEQERGTSYRN